MQQGTPATTSDRTPATVQSLLDSLKWNSLEQRRLHNRLRVLHRISSGLVDINLTGCCQHADPRTKGAQRVPIILSCLTPSSPAPSCPV